MRRYKVIVVSSLPSIKLIEAVCITGFPQTSGQLYKPQVMSELRRLEHNETTSIDLDKELSGQLSMSFLRISPALCRAAVPIQRWGWAGRSGWVVIERQRQVTEPCSERPRKV